MKLESAELRPGTNAVMREVVRFLLECGGRVFAAPWLLNISSVLDTVNLQEFPYFVPGLLQSKGCGELQEVFEAREDRGGGPCFAALKILWLRYVDRSCQCLTC